MTRSASTNSHILFVDDSQNLLGAVRRTLRGKADLVVAKDAQEALEILEKDKAISVVISDQNMPGMKGIEFLAVVAQRWPLVTRVMQTGNNDQDTAISAFHAGQVFRFLRKPYEPHELLLIIEDAQAEHDIRKAEHNLLETTLAASVKLMTEMLSFMRPDLFIQSSKVHGLVSPLAARLHISQPWELSLAALLYPLGLATLPKEILDKRKTGARLTDAEAHTIAESGVVAGRLVAKIPKLEQVATYLRYCRKGCDGSGLPETDKEAETRPYATKLLPLLIDIVELAEIRDISLKDAAMALNTDRRKYDPYMMDAANDLLAENAEYSKTHSRTVIEMSVGEIRIDDMLVSDLRDENGELLLSGGSQLTELMVKRIHMLHESQAIPRVLAIARAA